MNIYLIAIGAVLILLISAGAYWIALGRGWIDNGPGHNHFEGTPARMMDALEADLGDNALRRPDEGSWHAFEQKHPHLEAALDFDEPLPAEDRARYDTFWNALRDQDDAFWSGLGRGDDRAWAQLENAHGAQVRVPVSAGGGS